jgi:hypothetical protein
MRFIRNQKSGPVRGAMAWMQRKCPNHEQGCPITYVCGVDVAGIVAALKARGETRS